MKPKSLFTIFVSIICALNVFAADYYWIGGSGNWSDINHWATTSGGTSIHASIPNLNDDVYFDVNSNLTGSTITITLDEPISYCKDMIWDGVLNTPKFVGGGKELHVYGSMRLQLNMRYLIQSTYFKSDSPTVQTISSMGTVIGDGGTSQSGNFYFNGTATWELQDDLLMGSLISVRGGITLEKGTLITNGKNVNVAFVDLVSAEECTLNIENSEITLRRGSGSSRPWKVIGINHTLLADNSVLKFTGQFLSSTQFTTSLIGYPGDRYNVVEFTNPTSNYATIENDVFVHKVTFKGGGYLNGNIEIDSLIMSPNQKYNFGVGKQQKINELFLADNGSCDGAIELFSTTTANIEFAPSCVVVIEHCNVQNLTANPAGIMTNASVDLGGNTGFNFPVPLSRNLYWVGGQGDWSDSQHWSLSSNGMGGECIPTLNDNVFFDNNSGFSVDNNEVIVTGDNVYCKDMTWANAPAEPTLVSPLNSYLNIYGSLALQSGMNYWVFQTNFRSANQGEIIRTNGTIIGKANDATYAGKMQFDGGGEWTLQDAIVFGGGGTAFGTSGAISFLSGKFNSNGQYIETFCFVSNGSLPREINIENSEIVITANNVSTSGYGTGSNYGWYYAGANKTLFANGSHIKMVGLNNSTSSQFFVGDKNDVYDRVSFTNAESSYNYFQGPVNVRELRLASNMSFAKGYNEIDYLYLSPGKKYELLGSTANGSMVINQLLEAHSQNCDGLIILTSTSPTIPAKISFSSSAMIDINALSISNINVLTGMITANNSNDEGGNTNIAFPAPLGTSTMYWVGGSGSWIDQDHWSTIPNDVYPPASPGCVPTLLDNVVFNDNSWISGVGTEVQMDIASDFYCHDMRWEGTTAYSPSIEADETKKVNIYGSLKLQEGMDYKVNNTLMLSNDANETIETNDVLIGGGSRGGNLTFNGTSSWTFLDDVTLNGQSIGNVSYGFLFFTKGTLNTNDKTVSARRFTSTGDNPRTLNLGNSTLLLNFSTSCWSFLGNNKTLNAGTSTIRFLASNLTNTSNSFIFRGDNNDQYYHVIYENPVATYGGFQGPVKVELLQYNGNGDLFANNEFEVLIFAPGKTYTLESNTLQTVTNMFYASGNPCKITTIKSSTTTKAKVKTGVTNYNYVTISGIDATSSPTTWHFGAQSVDNGNNLGMTFDPYDPNAVIDGLGGDVEIAGCKNISLQLNVDDFYAGPETTFEWSDGSTGTTFDISDVGTYGISVNYGEGCVVNNSVTVTCYSPLPVELTAFFAHPKDCGVELIWKTASEVNNAYFIIYRSVDGVEWNTIARIEGKGNTSELSTYQLIDEEVERNTMYYYYLAQVDWDGTSKSYDPISVKSTTCEQNEVLAYPNPSKDVVYLRFPRVIMGKVQVRLIDNTGRVVLEENLPVDGKESEILSLSALSSGVYFIRVESDDNQSFEVVKFVKE